MLCRNIYERNDTVCACVIETIGISSASVCGIERGGLLYSEGTSMKQGMVQYILV